MTPEEKQKLRKVIAKKSIEEILKYILYWYYSTLGWKENEDLDIAKEAIADNHITLQLLLVELEQRLNINKTR